MSSYTVTHRCGHTKTYYSLFADGRDAAAKSSASNTDCQDCIDFEQSQVECEDPFRTDMTIAQAEDDAANWRQNRQKNRLWW